MSDASFPAAVRSAAPAREIALSVAIIALCAVWPPVHMLDLWLQSWFFDAAAGVWLVPPGDHGVLYGLFYRGPKLLLSVAAGVLFMHLLLHAVRGRWREADTRLFLVLCVVGFTPLIVGILKDMTGVSCPVQEFAFGGFSPHVTIWDRLLHLPSLDQRLQCWPGGHAAAGFGLLGLRLLSAQGLSPLFRYWWPGVAAGWTLGIFQMARGQHYLSHTIVTMALAILVSSLALAIRDRLEQRG